MSDCANMVDKTFTEKSAGGLQSMVINFADAFNAKTEYFYFNNVALKITPDSIRTVSYDDINFFIPSGSGQASTTMPIMTPLADIVGITRQTAVLAFQFGDGFTNAIIPTHGTLCASLGIAGIPFNKWFKFALPVVAVELLICSAFVIFAAVTGYGPF